MFIYGLYSGQLVLYVGKTILSLKTREINHRSKGNAASSKYIPSYIDWEIKLIEECEESQGTLREQYWYDTLKPLYNMQRPGQTEKESQRKYYQTEVRKESQRRYQQTEARKEYVRKYQQTEAFKEYQRRYREKIKLLRTHYICTPPQ